MRLSPDGCSKIFPCAILVLESRSCAQDGKLEESVLKPAKFF